MSPANANVLPGSFSGVVPSLCLKAGLGPPRTECGVGALMPWADRLWAASYVSSRKSGVGTGLYEIDENLRMRKRPESVTGVFTNRFVHFPSNQLIIGPHVIDARCKVRTVKGLDMRICGTMTHLEHPETMVYMLGMEGEFFEMNVRTLKVKHLFDLVKLFKLPYVHFKAGYTGFGRVVVADNSYGNEEFTDTRRAGLLAEWDGATWTALERTPFVEVTGRGGHVPIFATGWDRASALLKVFDNHTLSWSTYRLPKASHTFDHMWSTEWPRIREVEHERFLMDCHGMFYELPQWSYGGRCWGVRPISTHLWVMGDFCSFRGMLVLGADNASPASGQNPLQGEPQSGLWFGKTDDLWQFGKPSGWGGPWWQTPVKAGKPSDPFLMTGFGRKCLHLANGSGRAVAFTVEADFLGSGAWHTYVVLKTGAAGYVHHEFPAAFSAHWVRVTADHNCAATAQFHYT